MEMCLFVACVSVSVKNNSCDRSSRKPRIGICCYAQDLKLAQVLGYEDTTHRQCILRPTATPLLRYGETPTVWINRFTFSAHGRRYKMVMKMEMGEDIYLFIKGKKGAWSSVSNDATD